MKSPHSLRGQEETEDKIADPNSSSGIAPGDTFTGTVTVSSPSIPSVMRFGNKRSDIDSSQMDK